MRTVALSCSIALAVGCVSEPPEPSAPDAAAEAARFGLVRLRASSSRTTGGLEPAAIADAHFVEYTGLDLGAVAAVVDVWIPVTHSGCVVSPAPVTAERGAGMLLLSAGDVGISGNGQALRLSPRPLVLGPAVHGVVYGSEGRVAPTIAAAESYMVWADGAAVPGFVAVVPAPDYLEIVAVDGRDIGSASATTWSSDAYLSVEISEPRRDAYLTVRDAARVASPTISCAFGGAAQADVPVDLLVDHLPAASEYEVVVRAAASVPLPESVAMPGVVVVERDDTVVVTPLGLEACETP